MLSLILGDGIITKFFHMLLRIHQSTVLSTVLPDATQPYAVVPMNATAVACV